MGLQEWETFTNVIRNVVQVAAVLAGGGWAYLKFVRGRTFHYRGELRASVDGFTFEGETALRVRVSFKNTGLSRIQFPADNPPRALVSQLTSGGWSDGPAMWFPSESIEETTEAAEATRSMLVLRQHGWVEPGETIEDEQLFVPIVDESAGVTLAFRVRATLYSSEGRLRRVLARSWRWLPRRPILWTAYAVTPGAELAPISHELEDRQRSGMQEV